MVNAVKPKTALISVFDKSGLEGLLPLLQKNQIQIYSTGGTATFLEEKGAKVFPVEDLTQFAELMEGRVKTLHPKVFGGILARREEPHDLEEAKKHGIPLFDLVIVNLYPFAEHRMRDLSYQSGYIDVGGPALIRAAAKNFASVTVLSDPSDYIAFQTELSEGVVSFEFRKACASRAFSRTSAYDALISETWSKSLPTSIALYPQRELRYGENPHQKAAWCGRPTWALLQGKELSYNNILDAEAATRLVDDLADPAVAIIKHNTPCGVASGVAVETLWEKALASDPTSAYGGVAAWNHSLGLEQAERMTEIFLEVVIAPEILPEARAIFGKRKNLRLVEWKKVEPISFEARAALGGWLVQESDRVAVPPEFKVVTDTNVPETVWDDLRFAWRVCKHVRSNAIVIAKDGATVGIGGGLVSRVDAVRVALAKAGSQRTKGGVLASDAFFPFRDNIDLLKGAGISAIIQPGGSLRDEEVIAACNELRIAMVFTGQRHFRH